MTAERQAQLERIRLESMEHLGFGVQTMKKIKVCAKCKNPSPTDQQFCKECGSRLPDKTLYDEYKERHKTCPNCDAVMHDQSLYCSQCGTRLNAVSVRQVSTQTSSSFSKESKFQRPFWSVKQKQE